MRATSAGAARDEPTQDGFSRYQSTVRARPSSSDVPRSPPEQPLRLLRRADVPRHLARPLGDVLLQRRRLAAQLQHEVGDLRHRRVPPRRDVDHLAVHRRRVRLDHRLDRLRVVLDVEPVTARRPVTVHRQRLTGQRLEDEARDHLLRMLARAVVVERPHDHDRQVVRRAVRERQPIRPRLRRRVGAARVQRMLLVHRSPLRGAVHLAGRDQDEALDRLLADRIQQHASPLHVRRHELGCALGDRLLHVRLRRGVHDHVHPADDLPHERFVADVAVHEREPLVRADVAQVLEVPGVGQRVERDHLVRRRLQQVADERGRDEARPAGDEDSFHSSRSIVYSGLPSTSRWMRARYSPTSARMNPCTPRTKTTAAPPKSGPGKSDSTIQYATP